MITQIDPKRLQEEIADFAPRSVLCIGQHAADWVAEWAASHAECRITRRETVPDLDELEAGERADLVLVSELPAQSDRRKAEQAIARLRDLGGMRVILGLESTAGWQAADLFALGFTRLGELASPGERLQLYAFDLNAYKTTPDWLNSRYWAHPELFGKYWW